MADASNYACKTTLCMRVLESHHFIRWLNIKDIASVSTASKRLRREMNWKYIFKLRWPDHFHQIVLSQNKSGVAAIDLKLFNAISATSFWNAVEQSFLQSEGQTLVKVVKKSAAKQGKSIMICNRKHGKTKIASVSPDPWQLACVIQDKGNELLRCRLCGRVDVCMLDARLLWEPWLRRTTAWVIPCKCPSPVHRSCAEKHSRIVHSSPLWYFQSWDSAQRTDTRGSGTSNAEPSTLQQKESLFRCDRCGENWQTTTRLPSAIELFRCALSDRLTHIRSISSIFWFVVGLNVLLLAYRMIDHPAAFLPVVDSEAKANVCNDASVVETHDREHDDNRLHQAIALWFKTLLNMYWTQPNGWVLSVFLLQQVVMLHIFFSKRFEIVVMTLWLRRGMYMEFYFRLYLYFVISVMLVLCSFTPFLGVFAPIVQSYLRSCGTLCSAIAWINFIVYMIVANIVLYIFFKTNYRVVTIKEHHSSNRGLSSAASESRVDSVPFLSRRPFDMNDEMS